MLNIHITSRYMMLAQMLHYTTNLWLAATSKWWVSSCDVQTVHICSNSSSAGVVQSAKQEEFVQLRLILLFDVCIPTMCKVRLLRKPAHSLCKIQPRQPLCTTSIVYLVYLQIRVLKTCTFHLHREYDVQYFVTPFCNPLLVALSSAS